MVWYNARTREPYAKKHGDDPNSVCGPLRRFLTAPKGAGDSPEESQLPAEVQATSVLPLSIPPPTTTTTPEEGEAGSAQVCNYATHAAAPDEAAQLQLQYTIMQPCVQREEETREEKRRDKKRRKKRDEKINTDTALSWCWC
jgi:hypothetical protein